MSIMDKNWLIRTKQHQILGPISKAKVLELLDKSSLLDDDELSSGNGYWFQVKETDLMNKYIYGDISQSFNPISEAQSVLTLTPENKSQTASINPSTLPRESGPCNLEAGTVDSDLLPDETDLEYPDLETDGYEDSQTQNTVVTQIPDELLNKVETPIQDKVEIIPKMQEASLETEDQNSLLPEEGDLEYPDFKETPSAPSPEKAKEEALLEKEEISEEKSNHTKSYAILLMAVLVFSGIFYGVYYYYTTILNKPVPFFSNISIEKTTDLVISKASATSELNTLSKKKK